jgi:hypothetical protein
MKAKRKRNQYTESETSEPKAKPVKRKQDKSCSDLVIGISILPKITQVCDSVQFGPVVPITTAVKATATAVISYGLSLL